MNILMLTNTYAPHVGGVARSVEAFAREYRRRGHRVVVVAPQFENAPEHEEDVIRVPAIQKFNGSDFSVRLPIPGLLTAALVNFEPDIVHAHHPFLLGEAAARVAAARNKPLVFTHHTMYERYTHYVPGDSPRMARFVTRLATGYANLCDRVFAPSQSVAATLRQRGVLTPIDVVPTGVYVEQFAAGNRSGFREAAGIPDDAFVIGHLGRLAPEKNLDFLAEAVVRVLRRYPHVHFLVVGSGPSEESLRTKCRKAKVEDRLRLVGSKSGQDLVDAYHAMDLFAFASQSETQGMVLTEAMAAGLPVVALDAPGVREVVADERNGRLLRGENVRGFAHALAQMVHASPRRREELRGEARRTAEQFSMDRCAERALAIYEELAAQRPREKQMEDSPWEASFRWVQNEWDLWSNLARSARSALRPKRRWRRLPGIGAMVRGWRRFRNAISRSEWGIRLLGLSTSEHTAAEPGLILVQIDGLSRNQFERALARGKMPFLARLIRREGHSIHTMYSGLPSSTPAVQAELFYGVKTAVPAFAFRDRERGRVVRMFESDVAAGVEQRLAREGRGLLEGGSAYANIYTGGADEAHFCAPVLGWGTMFRGVRPLSILILLLWHFMSLLRILGLAAIEVLLSLLDMFRGLLAGRSFVKELRFIPSRIAVSVVLRELITLGASIDAARGLPVIQLNYLGYDEQAHRRGPGSRFAHWSLRGIDNCIRRLWRAARRSRRRDYRLWVYSDHGQESTLPYPRATAKYIEDAVGELFREPVADRRRSKRLTRKGEETQRSAWLGGGRLQRLIAKGEDPSAPPGEPVVAAMGPVGHVYAPHPLSADDRLRLARRLVAAHRVPVVYVLDDARRLQAVTTEGQFALPEQAAEVLGADHPFLEETARDLAALCAHPAAGDLVLSGWKNGSQAMSFPLENGAHAGPGAEETRAFALLPPAVCLPRTGKEHLRPGDLRAAALDALGRVPLRRSRRIARPRSEPGLLRVMTYNVHSCVGVDSRLSPERIARLIAEYDPDVVALQELDVRRWRTDEVDQAHEIADDLKMDFHFYPAIQLQEERYGDAILSRYPMRLLRADRLPGLADRPHIEPRGAIWVEIEIEGQSVQVLNTHLGLIGRERAAQVAELLGPQWLGGPLRRDPLILCGDLNAHGGSRVYRRLMKAFRDVQTDRRRRPQKTWDSRYPVARIDHVLVSGKLEAVHVDVPRTELARRASDHLPLVVDLRLEAPVAQTFQPDKNRGPYTAPGPRKPSLI